MAGHYHSRLLKLGQRRCQLGFCGENLPGYPRCHRSPLPQHGSDKGFPHRGYDLSRILINPANFSIEQYQFLGSILLFVLICISIFTLYYRVQVLVKHKGDIGKHHMFEIPHTELVQVLGAKRRDTKILVRRSSMVSLS